MHSEFKLSLLYRRIVVFRRAWCPVIVPTLLILQSATRWHPCFDVAAKLELIEQLFLFNRQLDDTDEVLILVDVEEHALNALEGIKADLSFDYLVILLNLLLEKFADKRWLKPITLLKHTTKEPKECLLVSRQLRIYNQNIPKPLQMVCLDARSIDHEWLKDELNAIQADFQILAVCKTLWK